MDVSVIIPVYNSEKSINRVVKCFCEQINTQDISYEILLINDGSTDNSLQICKELKTAYANVKVFTQENKGPSAARNVGIKNASGEKIMFCDADDFVESDALSYLSSEFLENDLLIYGLFDEYYDINHQLITSKEWSNRRKEYTSSMSFLEDFHVLVDNNLLYSQCTKMYRKKIIDENGILFDESLTMGEDVSFNLAYFPFVNRATIVPKLIYHYVHELNSQSISTPYFPGYFQNVTDVYYKKCEMLKRMQAFTKENQLSIDNFFVGRISSALQNELLNTKNNTKALKLSAIREIITSEIAVHVLQTSKSTRRFYVILEKYIREKNAKAILRLFNLLKFMKTSNLGIVKKIRSKLS
ncbi:MAG: glycosyltransferase family A protein [Oscillospiraceae bacterium]